MGTIHRRRFLEIVIDSNSANAKIYEPLRKLYLTLLSKNTFDSIAFTFTTSLLREQCHFINNDFFSVAVYRNKITIPGADAEVVKFFRSLKEYGLNERSSDTVRQTGLIKTAHTSLDRKIVRVIRKQAQELWDEFLESDGKAHKAVCSVVLGHGYKLGRSKITLGDDGTYHQLMELLRRQKPQFLRRQYGMTKKDPALLQALMMVPDFRNLYIAKNHTFQELRADSGEFTVNEYYANLPEEYKNNTAVIFISQDEKARKLMREQRHEFGYTVFALSQYDFTEAMRKMGIPCEMPLTRPKDQARRNLQKDIKDTRRKLLNPRADARRIRAILKHLKELQIRFAREYGGEKKWQQRFLQILNTGSFEEAA